MRDVDVDDGVGDDDGGDDDVDEDDDDGADEQQRTYLVKRWMVAIRGVESGQLHPLTFTRFWTEKGAQQFVDRMERRNPHSSIEWIVVSTRHKKGSYQP